MSADVTQEGKTGRQNVTEFQKSTRRAAKAPAFTATSRLLQNQIRRTVQNRGFSEPRIITKWPELVGPELARLARPLSVRFGRDRFGATLTLLCTGASAPIVEMQKSQILQKLNDVYGYGAISKIAITQTAPTGFAEGQASFAYSPEPEQKTTPAIDGKIQQEAKSIASRFQSPELKKAIEEAAVTFMSTAKK